MSTDTKAAAHSGPAPAGVDCVDLVLHFDSGHGSLQVLDKVSVSVKAGELLCIVGPSGCGKTTVLNVVAGLLNPTSGHATVGGDRVAGVRRDVAYMTQKDTLFPWLSAVRNVFLPLEAIGAGEEGVQESRRLMELVGLAGFENHLPHQLSGGERKRVQLARALAQEPRVLLMDEPFGALDYQTKLLMHERFLRIWERDRKTILFVTHDLSEAIALADRILLTTNRPARVRRIFDVDIPRPRNIEAMVDDAKYRALYHQMWGMLREEFQKSQA